MVKFLLCRNAYCMGRMLDELFECLTFFSTCRQMINGIEDGHALNHINRIIQGAFSQRAGSLWMLLIGETEYGPHSYFRMRIFECPDQTIIIRRLSFPGLNVTTTSRTKLHSNRNFSEAEWAIMMIHAQPQTASQRRM